MTDLTEQEVAVIQSVQTPLRRILLDMLYAQASRQSEMPEGEFRGMQKAIAELITKVDNIEPFVIPDNGTPMKRLRTYREDTE